ncbi:MAG: hypothetical protein KAV45_00250 [Calditrichia bacterium]|nr:hypothetical protein [Calditrichia bacterium]
MNPKRFLSHLKVSNLHLLLLVFSIGYFECNKSNDSENYVFWTENNSPELIGKLVIDDLFTRPDLMMYVTDFWTGVHYAEACAGFGAARLAGLLNNSEIISRLSDRYTKVIEDSLVKDSKHVDANVYGILPFELYMQNH